MAVDFTFKSSSANLENVLVTYAEINAFPSFYIPNTLYAWGDLTTSDSAVITSPILMSTFTSWTQIKGPLAIKSEGTLWRVGYSYSDTDARKTSRFLDIENISQVGYGADFYNIIKTDGTLWGQGSNGRGELGDGTTTYRSQPVQIGALTNWSQVSSSFATIGFATGASLAIKTDGTLWGWGYNVYGQLGLGDRTDRSSPVQVGTLTNWKQIYTSNYSSLAIKTDGTLWAWGDNTIGQLGLDDRTHRSSPTQVGALTNWKEISTINNGGTNGIQILAVKTDGTLWAWGRNNQGQLGLGDRTHRSSPVQVGALTNWSKVAGLGNSTTARSLAVKTDGTLWAWGNNTNGELGDGTTIHRSSPVQIGALTTWKDISADYTSLSTGGAFFAILG